MTIKELSQFYYLNREIEMDKYLIAQGCQDEDVMATIRDRAGTHEAVMRALKARIKKIKEEIAGAVLWLIEKSFL